MKTIAVALLAALVFAVPISAQCGSGCYVSSSATAGPTWKLGTNPRYIYCNDPAGCWDYIDGLWYPWDGKQYGMYVRTPPIAIPAHPNPECLRKPADWRTNGVDMSRVGNRPEYVRNGHEVSREQAINAIKRSIPDDSGKKRITVIGSEEERKAALAQIGNPDWAVVKAYDPSNWAVADYGFVTGGHPTIYVQEVNGKVVHRQDELTGLATALRQADPSYDPRTDPDLRVGPKLSSPGLAIAALIVGLLAVPGFKMIAAPIRLFLQSHKTNAQIAAQLAELHKVVTSLQEKSRA